jgi:ABC-type transport system substrate-binding protein
VPPTAPCSLTRQSPSPRHAAGGALLVVAVCCAALAGAACGRSPAPASRAEPLTLSIGIAQPPGGPPDLGLAAVAALLQNTAPVTFARDGRAGPGLAVRWEESADGLAWRFWIREGLTFHDGSPLTAADLKGALEDQLSSPGPFGVTPGLRDVRGVEAPSPTELVVRLVRPSALLLEAIAQVPVATATDPSHHAGPYVPVSRESGRVVLEAFEAFHRGRPHIQRVELRSYQTPRTAWSALLRDEIDFLYEAAPEAVEFLKGGTGVREYSFLRPYVYLVGFNLEHPALGRADVRRALSAAVDRAAVVQRALSGRGVPAYSHVWPQHWAYEGATAPPPLDARGAMAALDAAGWPLGDAARETASPRGPPSRFRFTCLIPADYPLFERLALIVQKQLDDVGVDMLIEPVSARDLQLRLNTGRFDAYLLELAAGQGFNFPYWLWHSTDGSDHRPLIASGYRGADAALDEVRTARTDAEMKAAVAALQRAQQDDPPAIFLAWREISRAVTQRYVVPVEDGRDILGSVPQWTLSAPERTR